MKLSLSLTALVLIGCTTSQAGSLSKDSLVGKWKCGPTNMHGPNFDIAISTETENKSDGTYTTLTTSLITPEDGKTITTKDLAFGTWRLDKDIVTSTVESVKFFYSSDPSISLEAGQKAQDDQVRKKSTYQSKILEFTGKTSTSIPVNSMYKEASVPSNCTRV